MTVRRGEEYCPLCGAHEFEADEGYATDAKVVKMTDDIEALYKRLKELTGEWPRS